MLQNRGAGLRSNTGGVWGWGDGGVGGWTEALPLPQRFTVQQIITTFLPGRTWSNSQFHKVIKERQASAQSFLNDVVVVVVVLQFSMKSLGHKECKSDITLNTFFAKKEETNLEIVLYVSLCLWFTSYFPPNQIQTKGTHFNRHSSRALTKDYKCFLNTLKKLSMPESQHRNQFSTSDLPTASCEMSFYFTCAVCKTKQLMKNLLYFFTLMKHWVCPGSICQKQRVCRVEPGDHFSPEVMKVTMFCFNSLFTPCRSEAHESGHPSPLSTFVSLCLCVSPSH